MTTWRDGRTRPGRNHSEGATRAIAQNAVARACHDRYSTTATAAEHMQAVPETHHHRSVNHLGGPNRMAPSMYAQHMNATKYTTTSTASSASEDGISTNPSAT